MPKQKQPELSMTASIILCLVGLSAVLGMVVHKKSTAKPPAKKQQADKISPEEAKAATDIFGKAFVIGRTMSRAGVIEPDGKEIDAMARAAQTKYGDTHSRQWFKYHFEMGFWSGWESR